MILEKHFSFDPAKGLEATNQTAIDAFIRGKAKHFSDCNNWLSKAERMALLDEINRMFDEDEQSIDVDLSKLAPTLYYEKIDKRNAIMYFDYLYLLGAISWDVFDKPGNRLVDVQNGIHGAVSTADIMCVAYNDMIMHKRTGDIVFVPSAALILATLVESQCKIKFKEYYTQNKLDELEAIINAGTYTPSAEDNTLIDCLRHRRKDYNAVYVESLGAIELFQRTGITIDPDGKRLLDNTLTLNQLVQYSEFRNVVEPAFLVALERIFGTRNLNLRNDAAHGGFGYRNYYFAAVAGTLYNLVTMISEDMHMK